jgi:DNA-binding beta-propeller fold protein YncE
MPGTADFVPSGNGGLVHGRGLLFDSIGTLLVASIGNDRVLKYDGATGAFLSTFVSPGSGGLGQPHSMTLGPDGNLYVGSNNHDAVFRYDGITGQFMISLYRPAMADFTIRLACLQRWKIARGAVILGIAI